MGRSNKTAKPASKKPTAKGNGNGFVATKKTECPITREQFRSKSSSIASMDVHGTECRAKAMEFSTGSFGWNLSGKIKVIIDGEEMMAQVSGNVVVIGSKEV